MPANSARAIVTPVHALLVVAGAVLTALYWHAPYAGPFDRTLAMIGAQLILFGVAAVAVLRSSPSALTLTIVLGFACLFRMAALNYTPFLSSDVYRYVWDGRVQAAGINPYRYLPADPELAHLRDEAVYPNINRRDSARTIYPPVAEALFYGVTRIHDSVFAMRVAMVGFEALAIAGLVILLGWLSIPRAHIILFAWHPLAVWEIAGSGHLDAVVLAAMAAAFLAHHRGRSRLSVMTIGLAALVKLYPLALLPVFWRRWDWRSLALIGLLALAAYAPYAAGAGWGVLGYLPGYLAEEGFQTGDRFFVIDFARRVADIEMSPTIYLAIAAGGLGAIAIGAIAASPLQGRRPVAFALTLAAAATLAVSPSYPWYFLWLLPCLPVVPSVPLLVVAAAGFVQYVRYVPGSTLTGYDLHLMQYGGFAGVALGTALISLVRGRRTRPVLSGDTA